MSFPSLSRAPHLERELLSGLNREQQEAILSTEGPVLIIAGAGTGKTRVIAHRIAYLLRSHTELSPATILALTFSRKASQEMLQRVEDLLGTYADELGVFTFHSFCHRFLQDHALEVGFPSQIRLLDRAEAWVFFRRLLPELRLTHHGSVSDPTDRIEGFLRFIARAKDELVDPEEYALIIQRTTDLRERSRQEEIHRVYRMYQQRLRDQGFFDFGDLLVQTYRILKENRSLLENVMSRYRYILVDEFQDTNVAQIELLKLLAGPEGNLCVVGDDDQAIYRFRGASFASFLLMREAYPKVKTIRLTQNYRSTQRILQVAERLIRYNEPDRYDPQKKLSTENPIGVPMEVKVCRDESDEAQEVVKTIQALVEGQPPKERRYDRIAVLYRAHAHRDRLVEALRASRIPFFVQGGALLFEQEPIEELINFLRVLADPSDSVSLFRTLSHPIWGIPSEDLMVLSRSAKEKGMNLRQVLEDSARLPLSKSTRASISDLCEELKKMERKAIRRPVSEWIPEIAEETSLKVIFHMPSPGEKGRWTEDPLISLGRFLRFVYRISQLHPDSRDLKSFLWYLESYIQAGGDPAEEEEPTPGNRVNLMTIHQAKGLEFDWVILLGMVQGRFPARERPEPIPFPVELMKERLPKGDYHLQEERRLCYVALTRAREGLTLMTQERTYHRPSVFVREILEGSSPQEITRQEASPQQRTGEEPLPPSLPRKASLAFEREILKLIQEIRALDPKDDSGFSEAVEKFRTLAQHLRQEASPLSPRSESVFPGLTRFSYTQLETYRYCPLKYQYSYIYQIPVKPTAQMNFGADIHCCLEAFFRKIMSGRVPSLEDLLDSFQRLFSPGRYGEPPEDQGYQDLGRELLTAFYRRNEGAWEIPLFVEKPFSLRLLSGGQGQQDTWIRGVVDRLDPLPQGGVEIIDYKTGKPKEDFDREERLQLLLYALACKEVFHLEPKRLSFYFLRNNTKVSFEHTPEDFHETRQRILEMVCLIRSGDFTPTPSLMKCRRCDFRNLCPASMA